jgi:hypothetical protein
MTAIDNAVSLMNSPVMLDKIRAVSVYVAKQVVVESGTVPNHSKRLQLATAVVWNPLQHNVLLQNIVSCDPDICTTTGDASTIPDNLLIQKVTELWTPVATMLFPA